MFFTIYQIQNKIDNKIYIGKHQTIDLDDNYMGSGKHLKRAQEKYGLDQFEKIILHVFDNEEDMNAKEAELVTEEFCSRLDTYNICPGGKGGWGYINQNSLAKPQFKNKNFAKKMSKIANIAKSLKLKNDTLFKKEYGRKISLSLFLKNHKGFLNKNHSDDWKNNHSKIMKEKQTGSKNSQYGTMWITNGIENKKIKKDDPIPEGWNKGRKLK